MKTARRQLRFRKKLRRRPVVIVESSDQCRVSSPFRDDRVDDLLAADGGADFGGYVSGGLPETNRRRF